MAASVGSLGSSPSPLAPLSLLSSRPRPPPPRTLALFRPTRRRHAGPALGASSLRLAAPRFRCSAERESTQQFERLFSNLNQATMKREPGSVTSAVFLVAGTTVGAGILAIPAVTQEAGFLASAMTCILCWIYMVLTGLLIAEVNVNTMCELGSGGVSLVSMAMRTLGKLGILVACGSYIFIHYALLVAYVARSSDILTAFLGIPLWESATLFSLVFGGICYFGSQRFIGATNGILIFGIITSFTALLGAAAGDLKWDSLLQANFGAVPQSIPIIALSFVYQNVVPVLCTNLEGNLSKVRCWMQKNPQHLEAFWRKSDTNDLSGMGLGIFGLRRDNEILFGVGTRRFKFQIFGGEDLESWAPRTLKIKPQFFHFLKLVIRILIWRF